MKESDIEQARRRAPHAEFSTQEARQQYEGTWRFRPASVPPLVPIEVHVNRFSAVVVSVCLALISCIYLALVITGGSNATK